MPDVILGIDPGSRNTGIAVLTKNGQQWHALHCETLNISGTEDHAERLKEIFDHISSVIKEHKPNQCAIETPVYGVDPLAMLKLGRAQAAAMLAARNSGIEVFEYYPKEVKKSITGNGNASKEQVAFMLEKTVSLPDKKLSKDATDALAVAWCHGMSKGGIPKTSAKTHQNNKKSDWKQFIESNPDRVKKP
jgi:crossover junction endodeoxyribonuclease RuvC